MSQSGRSSSAPIANPSGTSRSSRPWTTSTGAFTDPTIHRTTSRRRPSASSDRAASRNAGPASGFCWWRTSCSTWRRTRSSGIVEGSAAMMRRPSSTARSASRRVMRWRDAHSPILGSSYSAKPTITIGAGSDEPRFHGKTEFDRTSASTAAGSSAASSIEIPPPIEFPTSTTGSSARNLVDEPRHGAPEVADAAAAAVALGPAEPRQVHRQHPPVPRETRRHREPRQQRPPQPVDEHERAPGRPVPLDVVDGTVQVREPAGWQLDLHRRRSATSGRHSLHSGAWRSSDCGPRSASWPRARREVTVAGVTVVEVLRELERSHPRLGGWILDDRGQVRQHVAVFLGANAWPAMLASRARIASR